MVSIDPIEHYCSSIQEVMEGGAKLTTPTGHEGLTTDMKGRWTIGAFDTTHKNKKETPAMKEVVGDNETGTHEIGKFYMRADDSLIKKFEDYMQKFETSKDKKFQDLAMNVIERFFNIKFKGPLATGLPINET
jgi:hypothetical protein